jgi:hypothetical protein
MKFIRFTTIFLLKISYSLNIKANNFRLNNLEKILKLLKINRKMILLKTIKYKIF